MFSNDKQIESSEQDLSKIKAFAEYTCKAILSYIVFTFSKLACN